MHGVAARRDRAAGQPAQVQRAPAPVRLRRRERRRGRCVAIGDEGPRRGELLGRHRREVLAAQDLVGAGADGVGSPACRRVVPAGASRRTRCAPLAACAGPRPRRGGRTARRRNHASNARSKARAPPGARRASCAASSRRRPGAVRSTRSRPSQRVGQRPGADLQPGLAQHAAEGDDVPGEGVATGLAAAARPRLAEQLGHGVVADGVEVLVVLEHRAEVCSTTSASSSSRRAPSAWAQSIVSATPGALARSSSRSPATNAAASAASALGTRDPQARRSRPRARAADARSSGTGSGA